MEISLITQIQTLCDLLLQSQDSKDINLISARINIEKLDRIINTLCKKKQRMKKEISKKIIENKTTSDKLKIYFNIQPKNNITEVQYKPGINLYLPNFTNVSVIPLQTYAVLAMNNKTHVVYKYGNSPDQIVSCGPIKIVRDSRVNSNKKTLCCNNIRHCNYHNGCRFYHDPIIDSSFDTNVPQWFYKTYMVPKDNLFGDYDLISQQLNRFNFNNVRTLARYCANMNLILFLMCNRR